MKTSDRLWMLLVVLIWGCNFSAIKVALVEVPPLLLSALRFALVAFPAVAFLKRPQIGGHLLIGYGLLMFAVQFSLLFAGMHLGISAGLASLVLQAQVFLTIAFGAFALKEKPRTHQIIGASLAALGLALVAIYLPGNVSILGFFCILGAAAGWALANILSKRFGKINMVSLVAWGCLVATGPILCASLFFDGLLVVRSSLQSLSLKGVAAIAFIVYPTTLLGFALWSWQLSRYPVARVAPFTLLVPIVGMAASHVFFGETLEWWKIVAGILVVSGLCINQFGQSVLPASVRS